MRSAGNDIVARSLVNTERSNDPRFYSKILSPAETSLFTGIPAEQRFETFLWLCWSVKESAFKYMKRHLRDLTFSPISIQLKSISAHTGQEYSGCCTARGVDLWFRSAVSDTHISSVVHHEPGFGNVIYHSEKTGPVPVAEQSHSVRTMALNRLSDLFPGQPLSIVKCADGVPSIFAGGKVLDIPISFSHHGEYAGYSMLMPFSPQSHGRLIA